MDKYVNKIYEAYRKNQIPGITAEVIDSIKQNRMCDGIRFKSENDGFLSEDGRGYTDAEAEVFKDGRIRLRISIRRIRHQHDDYDALYFLKKEGIRDLFTVVEAAANEFKIAQYKEGKLNRILTEKMI